jgi:hypothetical protein
MTLNPEIRELTTDELDDASGGLPLISPKTVVEIINDILQALSSL